MTGTTQIFTPFRAQVLRATRLDSCGAPLTGTKSQLITDGFISVDMKGQVDQGTAVEIKNAAGSLKISEPGQALLKYLDVTLTLTDVNPDLYELVTGQQLITDGQGNTIGLAVSEQSTGKVAIETWTEIGMEDGSCDSGWGYFITPFLVNGLVGDVMLNDTALSCTLTARTKRGSQWGVGPATYLVADSSSTSTPTPAVLATAIGPKEHYRMFRTPIAPPAVTGGAVAL